MTFYSIALKTARKKFGTYIVYFLSVAFSVAIFYMFYSMYYNPAFEAYRFGSGKITTLFRGSAIAVMLFAVVFVTYSGNYFVKAQKKEIAIYSLLGMRKTQIASLMFLETFFIGVLAIVVGIAVSAFTSGYFTSLLTRFMAVEASVSFNVEPRAIMATVVAFSILFCVSGIRAYSVIYRFSLIDLISASKRNEGAPSRSLAGAAISVILIAIGYTIASNMNLNAGGFALMRPALIVILFITAGTYLLFRNLIPMLVSLIKRNRAIYFKTSNFISVSQIAFRLKANSRMLSVISIICAVTVTMISASYSLYRGLEDSTDFYAPFSYLAKGITSDQHDAVIKAVEQIGDVKITADDRIELANISFQDDSYAIQSGEDEGSRLGESVNAYMLSESMYKRIIIETQTPRGQFSNTRTDFKGGLANNECFFIDGNVTKLYSEGLLGREITVNAGDSGNRFTVKGVSLHKYLGLLDLYQKPSVVVSDAVYEKVLSQTGLNGTDVYTALMFDDEMASLRTVDAINSIIPPRFENGGLPVNVSYIGMYRANFSLYGSYVFIGFFIGILFMLATGSVMYYKLVTEAHEEAPRYEILRKTGMKKLDILSSIIKQLGLVYLFPLLVGLAHTAFALKTYNRMMELIGQETPTLQNAALVVGLFTIVYGAFYILSVKSYSGIVKQTYQRGCF